MMKFGFDTALGEITLVLFTTLAPSGAFALLLIALMLTFMEIADEVRRRINKYFSIPLIISMVGLVASATHLGNPANALYVFLGVGRSPLSTEVFSAVILLFLSGMYWLYSFSKNPNIKAQRIWTMIIIVASIVFITSVALVYNARTIPSWNSFFAPLGVWLNAIVGGSLVALLTLHVAKADDILERFGKVLSGLSLVTALINALVYIFQGRELPGIINSFGSAAELVPPYWILTSIFFICSVAAVTVMVHSLNKKGVSGIKWAIVSCLIVFGGIFLMRFAFYMMHMTIGLGF